MNEAETDLPADFQGTEITRFNALRHGVLSRYTVLPWEDADEYGALLGALAVEHAPSGPTEEHLVEELAGILWRKRRLRLAEAAAYRHGLGRTLPSYQETAQVALVHLDSGKDAGDVAEAIRATDAETYQEHAELLADEATLREVLGLLASRRKDAYEAALAVLPEDTKDWWEETLQTDPGKLPEDEEPATSDAEGLRQFVEDQVLPWFEKRRKQLTYRPMIREQAFGEALDTAKLERLGRYEVHLDRKLERTLAMLIRLRDLRQGPIPG